jgi:tRNA(fMet)-specific endonuclease VapC
VLVVRNALRMAVRTNLLLPDEVVTALDRVAGPRGRSRYVAEAVLDRIRRDERMAAAREAAGAWRDHPLFPTDASVEAWVRAGRAERTSGQRVSRR